MGHPRFLDVGRHQRARGTNEAVELQEPLDGESLRQKEEGSSVTRCVCGGDFAGERMRRKASLRIRPRRQSMKPWAQAARGCLKE